jgi:HK97 family phage portal protein
MTSMAVRETLIAHVLLWGNGYQEIVRNQMGDVIQLWPIPPNRIRPEMRDNKMIYIVDVGGEQVTLQRENVFHLPGLGFDGFIGYSVVSMAAQSIGLGKAMETFGSRYFGAGTHPGVIVSHPGKLSDMAHNNLKSSLTTAYSGLGQSHKLMLLEEGMKLEKLGIPPNDSQFLESRQFQVPEIARWFNLPPHKLKDLTKASFNNIESEQISFVTDSLLPWGVRIEQNLNMQLLSEQQIKSGLYFIHVFEGLLRGSSADRAEFYSKMFNIGAMSINEIRGKENLNPVEGGDIHLVPLNMTSLENAGKMPEPAPVIAPPEVPEVPEIEDRKIIKILPQKTGGQQ